MDGKYFWFQRNHFIVAVDAVSKRDAHAYARVYIPGAVCCGLFSASAFPVTACGAITHERELVIRNNNQRFLTE